ncbi:hypothetical protein A6770_38295 [Nostoc minutum NIES-26]|uniref:Uncharacterized protein n=1 Tax=Nostoc minutum NIES-26 TaxID=1844469 RepID=A0A367RWJ9_9NOSO|nr:hypothetical protein A6770_38295 [Nostoc minutum NIES-26]
MLTLGCISPFMNCGMVGMTEAKQILARQIAGESECVDTAVGIQGIARGFEGASVDLPLAVL